MVAANATAILVNINVSNFPAKNKPMLRTEDRPRSDCASNADRCAC
jgi:hypothetical protein